MMGLLCKLPEIPEVSTHRETIHLCNNAFHHDNPKVTDAMVIIVGILHKRGPRVGSAHLKECGRKIRLDMYEKPLGRLGSKPAAQREVIDQALTLLVNRGLASFRRHTKSLALTKKGDKAREALIQERREIAVA